MVNQCPRHGLYQFNCDDVNCDQCRGQALDAEGVEPTYLPGILGCSPIRQLPLDGAREAAIRSQGMGRIEPQDIDWGKLQRQPRKDS